ncbi:MAG: response regulator [Gammaproteobacteria bacterium]|jgi:CheY-like chemotaxis protein|nr:response regulator [Gammaproteobacteria bacterium]
MSKIKILVVDDEESLTRMLKLNLEETGQFEVRTENEGSNTLAAAHEFKPNLILLDIMMPDMIGSEVAEKLLEDKKLKDIKIIFLTALISKQEAETSDGKISGRSFIAKPVSIDDIIESIEKELGNT